jgi:hypothetical protein
VRSERHSQIIAPQIATLKKAAIASVKMTSLLVAALAGGLVAVIFVAGKMVDGAAALAAIGMRQAGGTAGGDSGARS